MPAASALSPRRDGKPTPRRVVDGSAIDRAEGVWHRGAVDADGKTGDGAGIHVDPAGLLRRRHRRVPATSRHAPTGSPSAWSSCRAPISARRKCCRTIVESEIIEALATTIYGWRQVPVDIDMIGEKANATRPEIEQIMIAEPMPARTSAESFERDLYRHPPPHREEGRSPRQINDFYICSLSCRSIIYKGMFLAESLTVLLSRPEDERFVSPLRHLSTSAIRPTPSRTWRLAQPFRMLAHNGEINTLRGNVNWMKSHEIRMASARLASMSTT
jgi:glutamate synthase (NADPH/NADH) large chain